MCMISGTIYIIYMIVCSDSLPLFIFTPHPAPMSFNVWMCKCILLDGSKFVINYILKCDWPLFLMEYGPLKSKIDWLGSMNSMFNFLKIFLYTFCRKKMSRRRLFFFSWQKNPSYAFINSNYIIRYYKYCYSDGPGPWLHQFFISKTDI